MSAGKSIPTVACVLVAFCLSFALPVALWASGPMTVINSHPLFISVASPSLRSAVPENTFALHINYSSTFLLEESREWEASIDLETAVAMFTFTRKLGELTEVGIEIPFISYNSGFLDGFLDAYHSTFGFPDYGRSSRPLNDYLFTVSRRGSVVVKGESGEVAPGDLRVSVKQALVAGDPFVSMYAFAELPSGDADRGYGNGDFDWGVAILVDKTLSESITIYLNGGYVFTDSFRAEETFSLESFPYGSAGIRWAYSPALDVITQLSAQGSPYETGIRELDEPAVVLSLGGKYSFSPHLWAGISFSEDLNTAGAPDFMVEGTVGYRY